MADRKSIGMKFRFSWQVERGKIDEFVAAAGDDNPIYQDDSVVRSQGYDDTVAPPTLTTSPLMWSGVLLKAFDELKMPLSRIMHAERVHEFYHEILPCDILSAVIEVKSIAELEGRSGALISFCLKRSSPISMVKLLSRKTC